MENFDLGIGGALLLMGFGLTILVVKILIIISSVYFISKAAIPMTAEWFGVSGHLTGKSKYDALAFITAWVFVVPVILTFFELIPFAKNMYMNQNFGGIFIYEFFLMVFTLFTYSKDLGTVTLKPFVKTLGIASLYYGIGLVLSLLTDYVLRPVFRDNLFMISYTFIKPVMFTVVTILLIKKNYRQDAEEVKMNSNF